MIISLRNFITQGVRFKGRVRNDRGITLTEIVAALAVSTILISLAAVAIITFLTKFRELSYFAELQQEAFNAVETVKYGFGIPDEDEYLFLGIANAKSVTLEAASGGWGAFSGITCIPDRSAPGHSNDYVRYYWDRQARTLRVQALYGIRYYEEQIFPPRGDDRIEVTNFNLTSPTGAANPRVVKLELTSEITISEDKKKEVSYTTTVALGR